MADEGYHEFHLEGKQLAFLFMTAAAVVVVSFLVGVMVGRGVQTTRAELSELVAAETVGESAVEAGGRASDPAAPDLTASAGAARQDEFSYYERLNRSTPPRETLREAAPVREPEPVPPPNVPAETSSRAAATPPSPAAKPVPARVPPARPPAPAPAPEPAARPAAPPSAASEPAGNGFVVQVLFVTTRDQAETARRTLASKGYPAFIQPTPDGRYRVRVGRYPNREEALAVARRLETEEKYNKPWVDR